MSQPSKRTPEYYVRSGGLRAILFGVMMGAFGLAFGSAVALGTVAVYLNAILYFACGLGMYFKTSRLAAVLALGLFTSGIVTFLVSLSQSGPTFHVLDSWNGWSFLLTLAMTVYFFGGSLVAAVRGAFSLHSGKAVRLGGAGSASV
ncbi:MAG: hypothetical protein ABSG03_01455 [Bryobacteraceae bacterium]|jgi:hypothetical protein